MLLIVEVGDTSVEYDRITKALLYGREGITEYWVVDLPGRRVVVHRSPSLQGYGDVREAGPGEQLIPDALPSLAVGVAEILPD